MITNETAKSTYVITSGITSYEIGFSYDYNPDSTPQIQLQIYKGNLFMGTLTYGTEYTISADGLEVNIASGFDVGDRLIIIRDIPKVQLSDYHIGRIDPEQIERDFDEAVMRDQQIQAEFDVIKEVPADHEVRISEIESKIPEAASYLNQMADKSYVDTADSGLQGQITDNKNTMDGHIANTANPHSVTAAQVGLGNCDNTADLNKPVSTATQTALDGKVDKTTGNYKVYGTNSSGSQTTYTVEANDGANTIVYRDANKQIQVAVTPTDNKHATSKKYVDDGLALKANASSLATVATSGSYNDLSNKPTIPTVNNSTIVLTQGGVSKGSFTLNQSSGTTIDFDAGAATATYHPNILSWEWDDHIRNDMQWLRADTFSWQDGTTYAEAYQHLVDDYNGISTVSLCYVLFSSVRYYRDATADVPGADYQYAYTSIFGSVCSTIYSTSNSGSITANYYDGSSSGANNLGMPGYGSTKSIPSYSSESIGGTRIYYFTASDGHKMVIPNQESNVAAIYTATGVAWYYVLDIENTRFKLPRTQHGVVGLRDTVGKYVEPGVPNITGNFTCSAAPYTAITASGAFTYVNSGAAIDNGSGGQNGTISLNASLASSVYGNSTTVQPNATQMYLYFYVGAFTQSALENTAGLNATLFNGKADVDLSNAASNASTSAKETIVGWGMPSDSNYDTLTLGASGTQYTAPADGYFFLYAEYNSGTNTSFDVHVVGSALGYRHWFGVADAQAAGRGFVPVKKGQKIQININGSLKNEDFKFVYADGE